MISASYIVSIKPLHDSFRVQRLTDKLSSDTLIGPPTCGSVYSALRQFEDRSNSVRCSRVAPLRIASSSLFLLIYAAGKGSSSDFSLLACRLKCVAFFLSSSARMEMLTIGPIPSSMCDTLNTLEWVVIFH